MTILRYVLTAVILLAVVGGFAWMIYLQHQAVVAEAPANRGRQPVAVEVSQVVTGDIVDQRTFNGTLRSRAEFAVAPKVTGRIDKLHFDLGDVIQRGELVAELDDAEFEQAVALAAAELAVADAELAQAQRAFQLAGREFERIQALRQRGIASESELDQARSEYEAREAAVEVAKAERNRRQASLRTAEIRRSYTRIHAHWDEGDDHRVVGRRYVNEGDNIAANSPIIRVLDIDTLIIEAFVTESDYVRLRPGQQATVLTRAYGEQTFDATLTRLSPVFRPESRQALVELAVPNDQHQLKPGLFVRVMIDLAREEQATIIPRDALVRRNGRDVVFHVESMDEAEQREHDGGGRFDSEIARVRLVPVQVGIRQGDRVQVTGDGLTDRVVTLGQQLLQDGSVIRIPAGMVDEEDAPAVAEPLGVDVEVAP